MYLMQNAIRPYPWGSRTAIATLLGEPASDEPQAEMWVGAHPGDPSHLHTGVGDPSAASTSLLDYIQQDPSRAVGGAVAAEFGDVLPFLLKLLAADAPLSLQVHPTAEQARAGFADEEARGIPVDAGHRNYKDPFPKPEMIVALTEFVALAGFRDTAQTVRLLEALQVPSATALADTLRKQPGADGLAELVPAILAMPADKLTAALDEIIGACRTAAERDGEFAAEFRTVVEIADRYPSDAGVIVVLLLNRVVLQPGEAIYLGAGNMHAYLSGLGVEIMACSDNVLRGGLTPKHVDIDELTRILDYTPGGMQRVKPARVGPLEVDFRTPTSEFALSRLTLKPGDEQMIDHAGPQVLLATEGEITVSDLKDGTITLTPGSSVFIPATPGRVWISGSGTVFRARDGLGIPQKAAVAAAPAEDAVPAVASS